MACIYPAPSQDKETLYPYLKDQIQSFIEGEDNWVANCANIAGAIGFLVNDLNWAGFYLYNGNELVLGPFWGKPAVTRIEMGKGVCGTAASNCEAILVPDVHQFPGHIACDLFSNSEIVLPIIKNQELIGVLDIDSPEIDRFDEADKQYLSELIDYFVDCINWPDPKSL